MSKLRILHQIPVYAPAWKFGGPVQSTSLLCEALAGAGHHVAVFTTTAGIGPDEPEARGGRFVRNGVEVNYFPAAERWGILSPPLGAALAERIRKFDIGHITGIWQPTGVAACRAAARAAVPYVVSIRGALSPYSWGQRRLKKLAYYLLFERRNVRKAAGIHYTSSMEEAECARLNLPGATCVIPNPLDLSRWRRNAQAGSAWRQRIGANRDEPVFINVGRLHHKKGLDLLPPALLPLCARPWRLIFVGPGEDSTRTELEAAFGRTGLIGRVQFMNMLPPEQLVEAYSGADCFLLPSRHENFGNVAIEALACGCQLVLSDQVGVGQQLSGCPAVKILPREPGLWTAHMEAILIRGRDPDGARETDAFISQYRPGRIAEAMAGFYQRILRTRK